MGGMTQVMGSMHEPQMNQQHEKKGEQKKKETTRWTLAPPIPLKIQRFHLCHTNKAQKGILQTFSMSLPKKLSCQLTNVLLRKAIQNPRPSKQGNIKDQKL